MPKFPPIPEKELAEIRQSVMAAVRLLSMDESAARPWKKALRDKSYMKEAQEADVLLSRLRYAPRPKLSLADVRKVILAAAKRDDQRFFIRLGKMLSRKPQPPRSSSIMNLPSRFIQFVVGKWAEDGEEIPALCRLTPEGLADVCSHYCKRKVSWDALVKLRQRLGLKSYRRHKVQVVRVGKKLKFQ